MEASSKKRGAGLTPRTRRVIVAALLVAASLSVGWGFRNLTWDDPHIIYEYARNAVEGRGLVFNVDERVMGFTTPLYTLAMTAVGLFTANLPYASNLFCILSVAALVLLAALNVENAGLSAAVGLLTGALLLFWPHMFEYIGIETVPRSALVYGAFLLFFRNRTRWAAGLMGLAILTRYDAVLAAGVLALFYVKRYRRAPIAEGLILLAILLPWLVFSFLYYGDVLPQTFYAKKGTVGHIEYIRSVICGYVPRVGLQEGQSLLPWPWWILPAVGLVYGCLKHDFFRAVALYVAAFTVGYAVIAPEEARQVFPIMLGLRLFLACGIAAAALGVRALLPKGKNLAFAACLLLLGAPVLLRGWEGIEALKKGYPNHFFYGARTKSYREAAEWLNREEKNRATVFTPEPGTMGYYSHPNLVYYDYYGLVTRRGMYVDFARLGEILGPDYAAIPKGYLGKDFAVPEGYRLQTVIRNEPFLPIFISRRETPRGE